MRRDWTAVHSLAESFRKSDVGSSSLAPVACDIVRAIVNCMHMFTKAPFRLSRHSQRRISGLLSMALCFWLLGFATHLHADEPDTHGSSVVHVCGVCASVSSGGAAPTVVSFVATPDLDRHCFTADEVRILPSPALASYQSRAPPSR